MSKCCRSLDMASGSRAVSHAFEEALALGIVQRRAGGTYCKCSLRNADSSTWGPRPNGRVVEVEATLHGSLDVSLDQPAVADLDCVSWAGLLGYLAVSQNLSCASCASAQPCRSTFTFVALNVLSQHIGAKGSPFSRSPAAVLSVVGSSGEPNRAKGPKRDFGD